MSDKDIRFSRSAAAEETNDFSGGSSTSCLPVITRDSGASMTGSEDVIYLTTISSLAITALTVKTFHLPRIPEKSL